MTPLSLHHTVNGEKVTYGHPHLGSVLTVLTDTNEANYSVKADTALSFGTVGTGSTPPNPGGLLCFQQTSSEIQCSSISSAGTLVPPSNLSETETAPAVPGFQLPQPGSALLAAWIPTPGTYPWELNVFYQIDSGDLIQYADATSTWVNTTLPAR